MRRMFFNAACASIISLGPLFGQGITVSGTGYTDPSIIRVAPGQITTLFVTGLKTVLSSQPVNATIVPLPTTLAGISVTLNQPGNQPAPVPLLSVQQLSVCSNGGTASTAGLTADCLITGHQHLRCLPLTESDVGRILCTPRDTRERHGGHY